MKMLTFENISAARDAIMDFAVRSLPEPLQARFKELRSSPSPVDQIVGLGEFLYANRTQVSDEAKGLAAGLIGFATVNAWHGLLEQSRGDRIVQALRRELGEEPPMGVSFIDPAQDPGSLNQYVVQAEGASAAPANEPA